jgi:hypothetical protein
MRGKRYNLHWGQRRTETDRRRWLLTKKTDSRVLLIS